MNTSYTLQANVSELLNIPRKELFGPTATARDYRDSYVLGTIINRFPLDKISELNDYVDTDNEDDKPKVPKSVSLRAESYDRLKFIANTLVASESLACRLIIYYFANNTLTDNKKLQSQAIEKEMASLKKALEDANKALVALEKLLK